MSFTRIGVHLILSIIVLSLFSFSEVPEANAVQNAFVSIGHQSQGRITGISANIQTPNTSFPFDQHVSPWVGIHFGDSTNYQFIQVGIDNQRAFWAVGGPFENSGDGFTCFVRGWSNMCPVPIFVDSITLQPNSIHNYALRHNADRWELLIDGNLVHSISDHGYNTAYLAYYSLETQWGFPSYLSNGGENLAAPIISASNIQVSFLDGSSKPLLTIPNGISHSYEPDNNVNGLAVDCSNLSVRTGAGLGHPSNVSCYVPPSPQPISTPSIYNNPMWLLLIGSIVFFIIAVIIRIRRK